MSHQGRRLLDFALQPFRTREYPRGPRSAKRLLEAVQNVSDLVPCCSPYMKIPEEVSVAMAFVVLSIPISSSSDFLKEAMKGARLI